MDVEGMGLSLWSVSVGITLSWRLGTRKHQTALGAAETGCAEVQIHVWHSRL